MTKSRRQSARVLVRSADEDGEGNATEMFIVQPEVKFEDGDKDDKKKEKPKLVGRLELFRYADGWDKILIGFGLLGSVASGICMPLLLLFVAESIGHFVDFGKLNLFLPTIADYVAANNLTNRDFIKDPNIMNEAFCAGLSNFYGGNKTCISVPDKGVFEVMSEMAGYCSIFGVIVMVFGYIQMVCWMIASERQAYRIRRLCLHNILRQNIGWFDMHKTSEINNRLTDDVAKVQDGFGDKLGTAIHWFSSAIIGVILGFYFGWKLSLVVLAVCPLFAIAAGMMGKTIAVITSKEMKEYAIAGGIAEEVFSAIRTVVAFAGQDKEAKRYNQNLKAARWYGVKKGIAIGFSIGSFWGVMFLLQSIGFWYGGTLHREEPDTYTPAAIMTIWMCILMASMSVGNALSSIQSLDIARGAAYNVYSLIEQVTTIDSSSDKGKKPVAVTGIIGFRDVHFYYPSRPDVKVLDGVSLDVHPGQTVAIVGSSGCGKSTTVQLLLRFYDATEGQVTLDGVDVKDLNIKWLRQHIGLVSQEPVLFATTIADNIRYGRDDVTMDEIIAATKNANAYDFIMQLPEQFETFVGERGSHMSGGQKQRIAIARALVRDPKILLLDEATSALDTESESIVQDALDKACKGRTTVIIAHRLSTIKNADIIIGYQNGQVQEKGTHEELMEQQGIYYNLVMNQMSVEMKEDIEEEFDNILIDEKNFAAPTSNGVIKIPVEEKTEEKPDDDNDNDDDDNVKDLPDAPLSRICKMNLPEWYYIGLGCIASIVSGMVLPAFGFLLGSVMFIFAKDEETQKEEFAKNAIRFLALGVISIVFFVLQSTMFALSGEALTVRLRDKSFRGMLKQDISWFDEPKNGVGALTTRLATDASQVQGMTGVRLGAMLMGLVNLGATLVIAFIFGWQMTLILIAFFPLLSLGYFVRVKFLAGHSGKNKEAFEGAGKVIVESVGNIRTVASLSKEDTFYSSYMEHLKPPYKALIKNVHLMGLAFSFSQSSMFFFHAVTFIFGGFMIEEGEMTSQDVFRVFQTLLVGATGLGIASAFVPDLGKAQASAKRILKIIDSIPAIDHTNTGGEKLNKEYSATVSFKDVRFHYPMRDTVPVLKDINFSVAPGQTLALVGSSGCGKTTTIQLMERFYDTIAGKVCIDDCDIKGMNVDWLRSQMALVSQEPVLFDQSIAENIAFGDNSRDVPMDEIVEAARTANIHTFITSLPDGYDTNVGSKGTQLSGGQRQRIAIARALVRNPKILLLDEATSSLDAESERVVQEALEKARTGRTCIVVAHRLSTIQNADKICVITHGEVTEQGTHNELMAMESFYSKLVKKSQRSA